MIEITGHVPPVQPGGGWNISEKSLVGEGSSEIFILVSPDTFQLKFLDMKFLLLGIETFFWKVLNFFVKC